MSAPLKQKLVNGLEGEVDPKPYERMLLAGYANEKYGYKVFLYKADSKEAFKILMDLMNLGLAEKFFGGSRYMVANLTRFGVKIAKELEREYEGSSQLREIRKVTEKYSEGDASKIIIEVETTKHRLK